MADDLRERMRTLTVPKLREALDGLPESWSVTANKVGNLALLDEHGEYTGWIELTDYGVMGQRVTWTNPPPLPTDDHDNRPDGSNRRG